MINLSFRFCFTLMLTVLSAQDASMAIDLGEIITFLSQNDRVRDAMFTAVDKGITLEQLYLIIKEAIELDTFLSSRFVSEDEKRSNVKKMIEAFKSYRTHGLLTSSSWNEMKDLDVGRMLSGENLMTKAQKVIIQKAIMIALDSVMLAVGSSFSEPCSSHLQKHLYHVVTVNFTDLWAQFIRDPNGRAQSGHFEQHNIYSLGHNDQCVGVENPSKEFKGQYCTIKQADHNQTLYDWSPSIGICLPSTCDEKEIRTFLETISRGQLTIPRRACRNNLYPEPPYQFTVAVIGLLIIAFASAILCTIINLLTSRRKAKCAEVPPSIGHIFVL